MKLKSKIALQIKDRRLWHNIGNNSMADQRLRRKSRWVWKIFKKRWIRSYVRSGQKVPDFILNLCEEQI